MNRCFKTLLLLLVASTPASLFGAVACALWPIVSMPYGTLYYASYYATTCNLPPQASYVLGQFNFPQVCPNCVYAGAANEHKVFPGLDAPVQKSFVYELPQGPADSFVTPLKTAEQDFVVIKDASGKEIMAKVFAFEVIFKNTRLTPARTESRTFAVAFEMAGTPLSSAQKLECKPVDDQPNCTVYAATYAPTATLKMPLLILTAKKTAAVATETKQPAPSKAVSYKVAKSVVSLY